MRSCLFSAVSRARFWGLALSRAESLRRLAAQLSSLATLEAAVAQDVQVVLEAPPEPVVPIPATGLSLVSRTSVPALAPTLPCPRPLMVVLVVPSCSISVAPRVFLSGALLWPRLIAWSPLAATPAPRPLPTALLSHGARLAWLAAPLRVSHVPQPLLPPRPFLRKASQRRRASGAAEARQRRRDKHPRVRRATKRSTWREN